MLCRLCFTLNIKTKGNEIKDLREFLFGKQKIYGCSIAEVRKTTLYERWKAHEEKTKFIFYD